MTADPYKSAPDRAFWSRSVARTFAPATVVDTPPFQLGPEDRFMSAGSCFASNVRRYLESWGYHYVATESTHAQWPESAETLYYDAFSARYGNVYTARQMAQLLERVMGTFRPDEEYWETADGEFIDPFRPGLAHRAWSVAEFRALTDRHLAAVRRAVEEATVFVFTLGLTEAWRSRSDGAVFPACPGTVSGEFDPDRHEFVNFTVAEITEDLEVMVRHLRTLNPQVRIILTVSPVPLVATATGRHVLSATTYSKSALRVAADQLVQRHPDVLYFPAYEIVVGPQNQETPFESDLRSVREPVVASVMAAFAESLLGAPPSAPVNRPGDPARDDERRTLMANAVEAECEEMMADRPSDRPEKAGGVGEVPRTPPGSPASGASTSRLSRLLGGKRRPDNS